jgi:tetratricopeptide (TPR) repeat protein
MIAATDGTIAANNLESAREAAWSRFWRTPGEPGLAECILEQEQLVLQFLGDHGALARMETLADQIAREDADPARTALVQAQVASNAHRFTDARSFLAHAESGGAPPEATARLSLAIDQATGTRPGAVLAARRDSATRGGLENLVPLGALLADLGEFEQADDVYHRALREYGDVSPFAPAWVCFQLGMLWGELAAERDPNRAARWYEHAIAYVPGYVKARVHLAEIYLQQSRPADAYAALVPVIASGDPEVSWRLADALVAMGRPTEADAHMQTARSGFEALLQDYELAFADHGTAFYNGSGNDVAKARELARVNYANRPTSRALAAVR